MTASRALKPLVVGLILIGFLALPTHLIAQVISPQRAGHVNDLAGVIDERARVRLENLLINLEHRSGVQLDVATVQTTAGQNIFDYSRQLSRAWDVGARASVKKSLLLVVAVDEKVAFTQFSRSVQNDLPDGLLGEIAQRLRPLLTAGQYNLGINDAVEYFIIALGNKLSFSLADLDQQTLSTATMESPSPATDNPAPMTADNAIAIKPTTLEATRKRQVRSSPTPTPEPEPAPSAATSVPQAQPVSVSVSDEDESEEVELTLTLPMAERPAKLKTFLEEHPNSKARPRAIELLVSSHAALGDQLLSSQDSSGIDQLMLAIDEAPADVSEKLFSGVISQIPLNLYLRNERIAAFKAAQSIEAKFGNDPKRLLGLASFYLGIERGDEAVRVASKAVTLLPDSAEAHYSLGLGLHISLRLDDAANEYRRAIELDSNFRAAHRSLADLNRAAGKAEEALVFYREQLNADPKDKSARAGVVLSLLDVGRTEEGEKELEAALVDDPRNVSLLAGSAYWFAAHANSKRALELATRAVEIEPRYTWSQIALGRALLGEKKPLEAERALRFARQYGKFPTLDYELATVLAAMGLYEEAAEVLSQSFWLKGNEIETRLAGRILSRSESFSDLLAPERKASLFQNVAADTAENARLLKALLEFAGAAKGSLETTEESAALVVAGKAFAAGPDPMRIYRQLFVASRLLRLNKGLEAVNELTQAAVSGVDEALEVPAVTVAVQADELRDYRSRAIASGGTPQIPEAPRTVLSSILRGRIEDITGWTLFYQDKPAEALEHLQRAVNVLPPRTPSWRTALWHLGAAQETTGSKQEALESYIKSYVSGEPDTARRALIERLYAELNGSLEGLDQKIGAATTKVAEQPIVPVPESAGAAGAAVAAVANETSAPVTDKPIAEPSSNPVPSAEIPAPNPSAEVPSAPRATPTESPSPEVAQPSATPSPEPSPTETQAESAPPAKPENQPTRTNPEPSLADLPPQPPKAPKSLKLTGSIKDAAGVGIANVVVVLISPRGSVLASTTDSEGNYSFTVSPSEKAFRVLPSKEGLTFTPLDKTLMITTEDRKAVDFVGNPTP